MNAIVERVLTLFTQSVQYSIPIFQRTYSWKIEQCEQLLHDILRVGDDSKQDSHFIGSIVYTEQHDSMPTFQRNLIIDGQQRMITISLLIAAITIAMSDRQEAENLKFSCLINQNKKGIERQKMLPLKKDNQSFFKIISDGLYDKIEENNVTKAFNYFKQNITSANVETVLKGCNKLRAVVIKLVPPMDAVQSIFESLNSTGLDLTQSDLVRNYLLMDYDSDKQNDLYNNYWCNIEDRFSNDRSERFDYFVRDFLTSKTGKICNLKDVYKSFKVYSHEFCDNHELMKELEKFSRYYSDIFFGSVSESSDKNLHNAINELVTLDIDIISPMLMNLFNQHKKGNLSVEKLIEKIKFLENYLFRRWICQMRTTGLNKHFATLSRAVTDENPEGGIIVDLMSRKKDLRMPTDIEFAENFKRVDLYNMKKIVFYTLEKIERSYQPNENILKLEGLTIEHIMPQGDNLPVEWKQMLGDDWQRVHETLRHTVGNLTFTGYNSEYSNRPFEEKKNMEHGFSDSTVSMNHYINSQDYWNQEKILERAEILTNKALELWSLPAIQIDQIEKYRDDQGWNKTQNYDLSWHLDWIEPNARDLFYKLSERLKSIDPSIIEYATKSCISYKRKKLIATLYPRKKLLVLEFWYLPFESFEVLGDAVLKTPSNAWTVGYIRLSDESQIDKAVEAFKIAFNWNKANFGN